MPKERINNMKLGMFLSAGLLVAVFALYMIGKDQNLFTSNFKLRARFRDVAGLMPGNNVRYSGIQNGTVKSIHILDDTTIEVTMYVDDDIRVHIRKSSFASIGTEGLMGNKVVNISSGDATALMVEENDILRTKAQGDISAAMGSFSRTGDNAAIISEELLQTVRLINNSPVLQHLLYDTSLPQNVHASLDYIRNASARISNAASQLETTIAGINSGKGTAGLLLADKDARNKTELMIQNMQSASIEASSLMHRLDSIAGGLQSGLNSKGGLPYALLQDTALIGQIARSMAHIEVGTAAFSQDMEALKHNFLTRGYFRRMERKNKEQK